MSGILAAIAGAKASGSAVTFTPDGSASSATPVALYNYSDTTAVSQSITCSQSAVWNWVRTSGTTGSVSLATGASGLVITFSQGFGTNPRSTTWTVNGTAGGVTRYWTVTLETEGSGGVVMTL